MKASPKNDRPIFLNLIKFVIFLCLFFEAQKVWPSEADLAKAEQSIAQSRALRAQIEKGPKRELASFNRGEEKWAAEFEKLEKDDSDKDWFSEVDKVIEN